MDRELSTVLILAAFAAVLSGIGMWVFGDQISTVSPAGKTTGLVAGVTILTGVFYKFYISLKRHDYNKLNEEGLRNLLLLHFKATAHGLMHIYDEALQQLEHTPERKLDMGTLFEDSRRVVIESRHTLTPFHTSTISNIPAFLEGNLPANELEALIRQGLEILNGTGDISKKRAKAYDRIQHAQSQLLERLQLGIDRGSSSKTSDIREPSHL